MTAIKLTVNGRAVSAKVDPRQHLGDFLRDHLRLTGTHLGCEHGVCGACTVLIDDQPARSCITYAAACDGVAVRTIEGFDDDADMARLREAFSKEHGLQCGFCTPGMLIAARDIVRRLPGADEQRIRVELSGNLCRCTGYAGIVAAVKSVAAEAKAPAAAVNGHRAAFRTFTPTETAAAPATASAAAATVEARAGWTRFEESFVVRQPPDVAWRAFADLPLIASCLGGAELLEHDARSVKGRMHVKLGPISAAFAGTAAIERDDANHAGTIKGAGSDGGSGSRTRGEIGYRLHPLDGGAATKVDVVVEYSLQGALAQFSRSSLAQEFGRRLVADFAANLNARLGGGPAAIAGKPSQLSLWALTWAAIKQWFAKR